MNGKIENMNRREFLKVGAGVATFAAFPGLAKAVAKPPFHWAFLVHFGRKLWGDLPMTYKRDGKMFGQLNDEEFAALQTPEWSNPDHVRFQEDLWRELSAKLKADGCNMIVVDIAEFLKYPSHPEIAVKGSWESARLRAEVERLTGMGFTVVPKLNFSTCHHAWLGIYSRMVSTPKYYEVCSDLIRDTLEVFRGTPYLHIGFDEEARVEYQRQSTFVCARKGDLWWHDFNWFVRECEKHGVRCWAWADWARGKDRDSADEVARRLPKSVILSPYSYTVDKPTNDHPHIKPMLELAAHGFDVFPGASNCYRVPESYPAIAAWAQANLPAEHHLGMLMAPWMPTAWPCKRLLLAASDLIAEARRRTKA